jgi:phosphoribosylanthranilate isomerase
MIRAKVCGITRVEDAKAAANAGFHAIGLVFVDASKRSLSAPEAARISAALPPFVGRVGLFMDASAAEVEAVLSSVALNWLQFHGDESDAFCRQFGLPWIKAIAMGGAEAQDPEAYPGADSLLLDSHVAGEQGGSGETFDWSSVPALNRPWVLAGGLRPDNVASACRALRPAAVDVSSGVEVRPGIKDVNLMRKFMEALSNG